MGKIWRKARHKASLAIWPHPWVDEYPISWLSFFGLLCTSSLTSIFLGPETMSFVQLFVPAKAAHDAVAKLGELGNIE